MKFNSLQELKAKVAAIDAPLYDTNSEVPIEKEKIYNEIAKIINFQLNNVSLIPTEFRNLLLYFNGTNSYVSCHWYNPEKDEVLDTCGYSVVTFLTFQADEDLDEDIYLYGIVLEALAEFKLKSIHPLGTLKIYESDEGDEVLPIVF